MHAAEDMISDFLGAEEGPEGAAGQQAATGMLLQILQKSASMHAEVPKQAAIPLGIAILDPLCQLITSMLGLMHSQPAAAQVQFDRLTKGNKPFTCSPLQVSSPERQVPTCTQSLDRSHVLYRMQSPDAFFMMTQTAKCSAQCFPEPCISRTSQKGRDQSWPVRQGTRPCYGRAGAAAVIPGPGCAVLPGAKAGAAGGVLHRACLRGRCHCLGGHPQGCHLWPGAGYPGRVF